jgi:hypothetical protein
MDARRRHPLVPYVVVPLLVLAYTLSYAPMFRLACGRDDSGLPMGGPLGIYRPIDWMIDHTLFSQPLLAWAGVCGVESEFSTARFLRSEEVDLDIPFSRTGLEQRGILAPQW